MYVNLRKDSKRCWLSKQLFRYNPNAHRDLIIQTESHSMNLYPNASCPYKLLW